MPIQIQSTSDSAEQVTQAMGDLAKPIEPVETSASPEKVDETVEASETPEVENESDDSDTEVTDEPKDKGKKKGGFKRRIDKLNGKLSAVEQERDFLRAQVLKNQSPETPKPETTVVAEGKPKADDFETHDLYVEALTDWKLEQKLSARDAKQRESQVKTQVQKSIETHMGRVEEFKKSHADFGELMEDVDDIPISITVQQVILESDNGPELMYELAKNKDEYKRICALPAIAAARELGKFEAKYLKSDSSEKIEPKTTKAPTPIKPVKSNATGSGKKSIDDPNLSQREFEKLREEQLAKRA